MFEIVLGFLIWIVGGFGIWHAAPHLKAPLVALLLVLSFGITAFIGAARWLLDLVTVMAQACGEILLAILKDLTRSLCGALPADWQDHWKNGGERLMRWAETRSKPVFEATENDAGEAKSEGNSDQPETKVSSYEWALQIMGLEGEADLTLPKLKQRYRQMMTVVHPDKQFPNHVFAQQINGAMDTIKRERGWA